jgi:hypothetical protein
MMQSMRRETIVETLLNSLEAERYVRGALLSTIIDELRDAGLDTAAAGARALLEGLERGLLGESDFVTCVENLRALVHSATPESGVGLVDPLARTLPGLPAAAASAA